MSLSANSMKDTKNKKLSKDQKEKLQIILAWYNFAWAMSNKHHRAEQKRISDKASSMIEDIIL